MGKIFYAPVEKGKVYVISPPAPKTLYVIDSDLSSYTTYDISGISIHYGYDNYLYIASSNVMKRDPRTLDLKDSATISDVIGDGDVMTDDGEYIYVMTDAWGVNGERAKIYKIRESDMSVAGVLQPGARSMFKSPRIDGGYVYFIEVYDRIPIRVPLSLTSYSEGSIATNLTYANALAVIGDYLFIGGQGTTGEGVIVKYSKSSLSIISSSSVSADPIVSLTSYGNRLFALCSSSVGGALVMEINTSTLSPINGYDLRQKGMYDGRMIKYYDDYLYVISAKTTEGTTALNIARLDLNMSDVSALTLSSTETPYGLAVPPS